MSLHQDFDARIDEALASALRDQRIVGGVFRVMKDGELLAERAVGLADREANAPMTPGTKFRFASLTKPVVSITALVHIDRGAFGLHDDIGRFLPDFAGITVRHLLTHTSGLGYAFLEGPDSAYRRANVSDGLDQPGLSLEENLRRLAPLPRYFAPGTAWRYSLSDDVLGAVLERALDKPLPSIVDETVSKPLGLASFAFHATPADALATPYADGKPEPVRMTDGIFVPYAGAGATFAPSRALDPKSYPSGGAGMVGNAKDFHAFLEALRTRAIAPKMVDEMLKDQIAPITSPILGDGVGYGYGVAYVRDPIAAKLALPKGTVRWGGAFGHNWWIDRKSGISALLLTNTAFEGMSGKIRSDLEHAVYGE